MVKHNLVAQATRVPEGSRAQDFQPETRNPQVAPLDLNLQQGRNLQQGATHQLLTDNPNVRIIVPVAPARPPVTSATDESGGGSAWGIWLGILVVVIVIGAVWWMNKRKTKTS